MNSAALWVLSAVTVLALAAVACGDDDPANSTPVPAFTRAPTEGTPTGGTPTEGAGQPSGGGTATASATAAATPHVVVTASPDEPVASTASIPASELPLAVMTAGDGSEHVLPIEVPGRSEYGIGLSGRLELGERGMLFWYAEPTTQSFWMRNTYYDLSIAFVDGDGMIVEILTLEAESLETRGPGAEYRYAIEAPAGWFEERGIGAGDRAVLDFEIPDFLRQ